MYPGGQISMCPTPGGLVLATGEQVPAMRSKHKPS